MKEELHFPKADNLYFTSLHSLSWKVDPFTIVSAELLLLLVLIDYHPHSLPPTTTLLSVVVEAALQTSFLPLFQKCMITY
jgi:uncharacterized membrane protein